MEGWVAPRYNPYTPNRCAPCGPLPVWLHKMDRVVEHLDFVSRQRQEPDVTTKTTLRQQLRAARRDHVAALHPATRALILHRPPAPLLALVPTGATIGLYHATAHETPTDGYARFFHERGHRLALPRFEHRGAPMDFADWPDPWNENDCEVGPFGLMQPPSDAVAVLPDVLFVPLLGFTDSGVRLGQGGGHYDRWLAAHPGVPAIGLAWDVQKVAFLPQEAHDHPLTAVVTPTRLYGPFHQERGA